MLPRLEATVGHELGHGHRDAELYKNFDSCSGIKNADPLKEAALLSEAHSDVWGAETLAASFNPISDDQSLAQTVAKIFGGAKKENPYTDRLKTIRASLGWLCAPDDGAEDNTDPHPKNTYRLWLYMNNSSLRQALGCSVKENINSCSFM